MTEELGKIPLHELNTTFLDGLEDELALLQDYIAHVKETESIEESIKRLSALNKFRSVREVSALTNLAFKAIMLAYMTSTKSKDVALLIALTKAVDSVNLVNNFILTRAKLN